MLTLHNLALRRQAGRLAAFYPARGVFGPNKNNVEDKSEKKPLLEEQKTFIEKMIHFFSYTVRYAFLSPLMRGFKDMFTLGAKKEDQKAWYSSFWGTN